MADVWPNFPAKSLWIGWLGLLGRRPYWQRGTCHLVMDRRSWSWGLTLGTGMSEILGRGQDNQKTTEYHENCHAFSNKIIAKHSRSLNFCRPNKFLPKKQWALKRAPLQADAFGGFLVVYVSPFCFWTSNPTWWNRTRFCQWCQHCLGLYVTKLSVGNQIAKPSSVLVFCFGGVILRWSAGESLDVGDIKLKDKKVRMGMWEDSELAGTWKVSLEKDMKIIWKAYI